MNILTESTIDEVKVTLTGELSVTNAAELYNLLKDILGTAEKVSIDLSTATGIDISILQLICSAHQSALTYGVKLEIEGTDSQLFSDVCDTAGFSSHRVCNSNT